MSSIDIYKQYFSAQCTFNDVERHAVSVWLTVESDSGNIRYEVGLSFFPHTSADDFGISYDACVLKELVCMKGRRSKKRDAQYMALVKDVADELAQSINGIIYWDQPLIEARYE